MSFSREKRENEEFVDEKFLTRKLGEKNEKLTSLKLRFLGINEANFGIIKKKFFLKSKISKKLSHKNANKFKNLAKILPLTGQEGQDNLGRSKICLI